MAPEGIWTNTEENQVKQVLTTLRALAGLLLIALLVSGCSLVNSTSDTQSPSTTTSGAELGKIVTAESIDTANHNAPVNETTTFNSLNQAIYAVVEAQRIDAGTTMFARWSRDGKPFEDSDEIKADKQYQDTYVEFHLEPNNKAIDPGNYTVQVFVNGNPAKQANFTVE
jgi:hypothetical protein